MNKYIIICKKCGRILMKTKEPIVSALDIEIKCPQCGELLCLPMDIKVIVSKEVENSEI